SDATVSSPFVINYYDKTPIEELGLNSSYDISLFAQSFMLQIGYYHHEPIRPNS
ncbi:unnamed protein product, partial [Dovyalis caffra]